MRKILFNGIALTRATPTPTRLAAVLTAALVAATFTGQTSAQAGRGSAGPVQTFTCGELAGRNIAGASILSSEPVAATAAVTGYCRVRGLIDPKLNFTFNKAQQRTVNAAMSNTFGFGGHNTAVIFRKYR